MTVPGGVVVVTGSSGLIGYAVCRQLSRRYTVVGFDRAGPPHPPPHVECVDVDLTSGEKVRRAVQRVADRHGRIWASVIHLAAYYDFSGEPSAKYDEITVRGTQRLVDALQNVELEQFVFSSTMLVHAPVRPGRRIHEDSPMNPRWPYPESKVKTERLIRSRRGRIPAVLLRIAGVYDDTCHSIPLAHQIQRIYERSLTSRVFPGESSHGQAFVHLEDLVDLFEKVVERRAALQPMTEFLVGEPETVGYDELQRIFGRLIHGEEWTTRELPKAMAKAGAWAQAKMPFVEDPFIKPWMIDLADDHYALDVTRARNLLGWEPKRSLRETLPRMVAALKNDPAGWYKEHKLAYRVPAGVSSLLS
jgi:nucleoside-diphosphate-sugar epimerase